MAFVDLLTEEKHYNFKRMFAFFLIEVRSARLFTVRLRSGADQCSLDGRGVDFPAERGALVHNERGLPRLSVCI